MKRGHGKLIMKMKRMSFLVFIITNLLACSPEIDCFIADSVKLVKAIKIEGSDYFIYLRISGSHDKVAFYELYENKPTFDVCGRSNILTIVEEPIDPVAGPVDPFAGVVSRVVSRLVVDDDLKLRVVYTEGNIQKIDLKDVPIEVKSLTKRSSRTP